MFTVSCHNHQHRGTVGKACGGYWRQSWCGQDKDHETCAAVYEPQRRLQQAAASGGDGQKSRADVSDGCRCSMSFVHSARWPSPETRACARYISRRLAGARLMLCPASSSQRASGLLTGAWFREPQTSRATQRAVMLTDRGVLGFRRPGLSRDFPEVTSNVAKVLLYTVATQSADASPTSECIRQSSPLHCEGR